MPLFHRASISVLTLLGILTVISGCSTMTNRDVFPPGQETVEQVYARHFRQDSAYTLDNARERLAAASTAHTLNSASSQAIPAAGQETHAPYDRFTRDALRELHTLFPPVANRELAMYVFPHLATDGLNPVPGYVTTFWLYEGRPYALPGERVQFQVQP